MRTRCGVGRSATFAALLAGGLGVLLAARPAQESDDLARRVQATLDSLVEAAGVPGATLGVVLADGRVLGFASGMADKARGEPMATGSVMLQGSVGKTYFGAVALQLVAEGLLELDAPIEGVFGEAPWLDRIPNGRQITLRQLMGHTSGLVRYETNPRFLEDLTAAPGRTFSPEERLSYLFDTRAPFQPGEGWDYSDTNYILVAMLIEAVTANTAYEEIRRRFLRPLGLNETVPTDTPRIRGIVQGYAGAGNPFGGFEEMVADGVMRLNPQFEWGGGGYASTARDLARWTHHVQTGKAFDTSLLDDFRAGTPAPLGPGASYGLGVIMMRLPAGLAWGHSGYMPGYRTEAYHFPGLGMTLALQVNTTDQAVRYSPLRMLSTLAQSASADPLLTGTVEDSDGRPTAGTMVTATLEDGRAVTTYTDSEGAFRLPPSALERTRLEARLPGVGRVAQEGDPVALAHLRLESPDPVPPSGAAWLAALPKGEETRRFILDCTGCHVTDASRVESNGVRRDSASWHAAVTRMTSLFGQGTGFPIISSWAGADAASGWMARSFAHVRPETARLIGEAGTAILTEYPVPVPQDLPHDLMVDAAGRVLVTGMFTHQMYQLDPGTGTWTSTPIPVQGANPRALDIDVRGRWWVVLGGPGKVAVHDPAAEEWRVHDVGMYAHSIAMGPDGRAWVNGHFTHDPELIAAVDDDGYVERFTVPPSGEQQDRESTIPYGLRVAPDGTVWGTQLRGNRLLRLDAATGAVRQWSMPMTHGGPRRPDVAPDGTIWIPLYGANALARFDPATETFRVWDFPVEGALPYVVRVDRRSGTVWIGTGHGDVAASFDPAAEAFTLYPLPTRGALVRHLDVDETRGEVWFAYGASPGIPGKVLRIQPGG